MKLKKVFRIIFLTLWATIFVGAFILTFVKEISDSSSLKEEGLITKGVVTGYFFGKGKKNPLFIFCW